MQPRSVLPASLMNTMPSLPQTLVIPLALLGSIYTLLQLESWLYTAQKRENSKNGILDEVKQDKGHEEDKRQFARYTEEFMAIPIEQNGTVIHSGGVVRHCVSGGVIGELKSDIQTIPFPTSHPSQAAENREAREKSFNEVFEKRAWGEGSNDGSLHSSGEII